MRDTTPTPIPTTIAEQIEDYRVIQAINDLRTAEEWVEVAQADLAQATSEGSRIRGQYDVDNAVRGVAVRRRDLANLVGEANVDAVVAARRAAVAARPRRGPIFASRED